MRLQYPLILASKSPRRKALLREIGLDFEIDPAKEFKERKHAEDLTPEALVIHNAEGKALEIARHHENSYILGVDTIGAYQNHILNKPKDFDDAKRMLRILNGTTHEVFSGLCLILTGEKGCVVKKKTCAERTFVTFAKMSDQEIESYINSGESMDKAAAFAIQGLGSLFIEKIDGDYFNVIGLPVFKLGRIFKEFGEQLVG